MAEMASTPAAGAAARGALTIGVPTEIVENERRIALVPDTVKRFTAGGVRVLVQAGAGTSAGYVDSAFEAAGATLTPDARALYNGAELVLKVQRPEPAELDLLRSGQTLISFLQPLTSTDLIVELARRGVTSFSMDSIPRITRAQSMDALSSMSTISGYKAVLLAADFLPKFFPLLMTAAGTIPPAKVLIVGAGVAGLQAIATARRLGAVVESYDTRPVVKEQVESLGAKFVEVDMTGLDTQTQDAGGYAREASPELLRRQQETMAARAIRSDVVITTALVPGRPAPRLLAEDTVRQMQPGSVIVDIAAETGGNCEATVPGEIVVRHGVTLIGLTNLPSSMPYHASQMYAKNLQNLLALMVKDGQLAIDFDDEIVKGTLITKGGEVVHEGTKARLQAAVG
jgi:NAD(P) transhydrogenase subunit alpha